VADLWPTLVFAGPPSAGKSFALMQMTISLGCPRSSALEAHTWDGRSYSHPNDVILRSSDDWRSLQQRYQGVVLIWMEASAEQRESRSGLMKAEVMPLPIRPDWPQDQRAWLEVSFIRGCASQVLYNTGQKWELLEHLRVVQRRCLVGLYRGLSPGTAAEPLGNPRQPAPKPRVGGREVGGVVPRPDLL